MSEWTEYRDLRDPTNLLTIGLPVAEAAILWKDLEKYHIYKGDYQDDFLWQQANALNRDLRTVIENEKPLSPQTLAIFDRLRVALGITFFEIIEVALEDGIVGAV